MRPAAIRWSGAKRDARTRVFEALSDLSWHQCTELMRIGGNRYAGRIDELRAQGYQIDAEALPDRTRGKRYRLATLLRGPPRWPRVRIYLHRDDAHALLGGTVTEVAREAVAAAVRRAVR